MRFSNEDGAEAVAGCPENLDLQVRRLIIKRLEPLRDEWPERVFCFELHFLCGWSFWDCERRIGVPHSTAQRWTKFIEKKFHEA